MTWLVPPHVYTYPETTLQLSSYHRKATVCLPLDAEMHEIIDAFKTLVMSLGYSERMFESSLYDWMEVSGMLERHREDSEERACDGSCEHGPEESLE